MFLVSKSQVLSSMRKQQNFLCLFLFLLPLWGLNQTYGNIFILLNATAVFCLDESSENVHLLHGARILSVLILQPSAFDSKSFLSFVHCSHVNVQAQNCNNNQIMGQQNEGLFHFGYTAWNEFYTLLTTYFYSKKDEV